MKTMLIIVCIVSVVISWACCRLSGEISREEEAKEREQE